MSDKKQLVKRIRGAMATEGLADKMWNATYRARRNRAESIQKLHIDIHQMKQSLRATKVQAVRDSTLAERFAQQVRANGGKVFFAKTGTDAIEYVANLAKEKGADLLIKSKSLTSDEIEFNHEMEKRGVKCIETDLGELIVQMAHERPVHLVLPAIHKSVEDVARLVSERLGKEVPPEHEVILKAVRAYLRPIFLSAKIGLTGANVGVAETGTVIVQTNEGNARLASSAPDVHVVLMGLEKIVASWADVAKIINGASMSALGQYMTVYVSGFSGHSPIGGKADGREFHVIIMDNGRSKMKEDERFSDALNCIRCGACMNVCPTYSVVSGHTFGYIYPGPIGIPWTANVHGLDKVNYADLCISCGLCKEICPVDIDMPMMIARVKQQEVDLTGQTLVNRFFAASETFSKLASSTAPLSNWMLRFGPARYLMEKLLGVDRRRTLPEFKRRRLRRRLEGVGRGDGRAGKVVYFPDIYADYNDPEIGVKTVRILAALGYEVEVPDLKWSGMPYISYGEVRRAAKVAEYNVKVLSEFVAKGYEVVATEPTATYMMKDAYPEMVPSDNARRVAEHSRPFFEFIEPVLDRLVLKATEPTDEEVAFHIPCHDRGLTNGRAAIKFLIASGYKVRVVETGTCCGIGGTFGMKAGTLGYDLSVAVGSRLFKLFNESGCKLASTESSVCSAQIADGTGLRVLHPLHMVDLVGAR